MKRFLAGLVWCTLAASALFAGPMVQLSPEIRAGFGPHPERAVGLDDEFIAFLDGAKKTLDGAFFEFRHPGIVEAFIRAHKRGVKIRLVCDSMNFRQQEEAVDGEAESELNGRQPPETKKPARTSRAGGGASEGDSPEGTELNPFVKQLVDAGIPVIDDQGRAALMHNKFAVRDDRDVWTGSFNLTDTCSWRNANNAMQIRSPDLAKLYSDEFGEMFDDKSFGRESPAHRERKTVQVGKTQVELYFAPEDDPNKRIAEILAAAQQRVSFMQFAFTADDLGNLLVAKHREGKQVEGIFDRMLYRSTGPYGEFSHLSEAGVPVIIHSGEGKFHHKVFIVDPQGPDPVTVLGSENASSNGNRTNDENVLIVHSKEITNFYQKEFDRLFGKTAKAATQLTVSDFPFTGTTVDEVNLVIFANGKSVDKIKLEYPARWKVASQSVTDVQIFRKGQDTTAREELKVGGRELVLAKASLKGTGTESWLTMRFKDVWVPEIAGKYAILCSVAYSDQPEKWIPMAEHPVVWVMDSEKEEAFLTLMQFVARLQANLTRLDGKIGPAEFDRQTDRLRKLMCKVNQLVVKAAEGKNDARVETALKYLEGLSTRWRTYTLEATGGLKNLQTVLRHRVTHDQDAKAKELLAVCEALTGK